MDDNYTPQKNVGQPTKYKREYCQLLIEHMAEGLSFTTFGGKVGVCRRTLFLWVDAFPDFAEAKRIGTLKSQLWWENYCKDSMLGKILRPELVKIIKDKDGTEKHKIIRMVPVQFNALNFIFNMKNRFPEDYRDKQEIDHSGLISIKFDKEDEAL